MGDLIVTCWSRHGRNRHAGELIAQGLSPEQAVAGIGQTVEGITTAPVLHELSGGSAWNTHHGGGLRGTLRAEPRRPRLEVDGAAPTEE